jgi:capsular polysaccharide transport system permease protein
MSSLTVSQPTGAMALPRHAEIARALRAAARQSRAPTDFWTGGGGMAARHGQRSFFLALVIGCVLLVILPILFSAFYLWVVASNQYASEVRFAVRANERPMPDSVGALGTPSANQIQDSRIVANFIVSRGMVEELERTINLRNLFSRPEIDWLSRFRKHDSIEELTKYWHRRMVDVDIDSMSGIITVLVRAFTAKEAYDLANAVISISEHLANTLSERARNDALRQTKEQLERSRENLQQKVGAMRNLRDAEGVLDATETADTTTKMLTELRMQLLRLENEYTVQRQSVSGDSPQLRVLSAHIQSLRSQVQQLQDRMTQNRGTNNPTLSGAMVQFERLSLDRDVAQNQYIEASAAFERARIEASTQQIYLTSFLRPVMAEEALYPRRFFLWSMISVGAIFFFFIIAGSAVMARNHFAV